MLTPRVTHWLRQASYCGGFFCLLLLSACKPEQPAEATEEASRIADAQKWGETRDAQQTKQQNAGADQTSLALPADLPSPELFETTRLITLLFDANKDAADAFADYTEQIPAAGYSGINMKAVRGGEFIMGSPESEANRKANEGPQHNVKVDDFWISTIEIPWELYTAFMENGMPRTKTGELIQKRPGDELWDAVTQPTAPYTSMNLGMGRGYEQGYPAIAMSHYAACKFCEWLSAQTGRYYRLPTEAEWEYACRAGSETSFCYGDSEDQLPEYAWFWNNSHDQYQKTASKKPNAWGIFDMHGNVAEWVLDTYDPDAYKKRQSGTTINPVVIDSANKGHVVRGGSWEDDPDALRCAAKGKSHPDWNMQDPQNPKSLWYLTNGGMVGFRIVRPKRLPDAITIHRHWNSSKGKY